MDDELEKYAASLSRLSQFLPGYDQLYGTSVRKVTIRLIDVKVTGEVHVRSPRFWGASRLNEIFILGSPRKPTI
jgi:hypothetical protein